MPQEFATIGPSATACLQTNPVLNFCNTIMLKVRDIIMLAVEHMFARQVCRAVCADDKAALKLCCATESMLCPDSVATRCPACKPWVVASYTQDHLTSKQVDQPHRACLSTRGCQSRDLWRLELVLRRLRERWYLEPFSRDLPVQAPHNSEALRMTGATIDSGCMDLP